jgi:hypothetical protein
MCVNSGIEDPTTASGGNAQFHDIKEVFDVGDKDYDLQHLVGRQLSFDYPSDNEVEPFEDQFFAPSSDPPTSHNLFDQIIDRTGDN